MVTNLSQINPKDVASQDAGYWALLNRIKLQDGIFEFKNHPYLVQPMQQHMLYRQGLAPEKQCVMKATQLGFSEAGILASLHGMIYGHYPKGVLYLFPTTEDMQEFSKSRFGPLLNDNPTAIKRHVVDTNTTSLKRVHGANLYMRGARLSQTIDGEAKEAGKLRGISSDIIRYDEFDLMDLEVLLKAEGRLGNSLVNEQYFVSNPTVPGFGISALYNRSDQRHWFRRCLHCGVTPTQGATWEWYTEKSNGWTCAEDVFPNNVEVGSDGKGYIACVSCGKPVGLDVGCWVPKEPHYSNDMWGYQLSQLSSARRDPHKLLQLYTNPPDGNLGDVMRLKFGKPFISAEDKLTKQQVMGNCGMGAQLNSHHGPCAMGVDIRRHKNVVIGCRNGKNSWRILRVARLETMDEILSMAYRFNVRIAVVDIRPYEDEVRQFQKTASFKTFLCEYASNTPVGTSWNDKTGIVKVNRTEIMDASHRMLVDSLIELPADCPEVRQFATECASVAKVSEVSRRSRSMVFRYRKLGDKPDDYRHALNYFIMAAMSNNLPVVGGNSRSNRPQFAKNEYSRC